MTEMSLSSTINQMYHLLLIQCNSDDSLANFVPSDHLFVSVSCHVIGSGPV